MCSFVVLDDSLGSRCPLRAWSSVPISAFTNTLVSNAFVLQPDSSLTIGKMNPMD